VIPFFNHQSRAVRRDTVVVDGSDDVATDYVAKRDPRELKVIVQVGGGEMRALAPGVR
jgi:hypothetical protein